MVESLTHLVWMKGAEGGDEIEGRGEVMAGARPSMGARRVVRSSRISHLCALRQVGRQAFDLPFERLKLCGGERHTVITRAIRGVKGG